MDDSAVLVASAASDVVGWALIGFGLLGVAAGLVAAIIVAIKWAVHSALASGETVAAPSAEVIPWKEIFGLLKDLAKRPAGLAVVLGLVSIFAGAIVLHYRWF